MTLFVLLVLPFAAILHHAVFYRGMCMLNRFGPDYIPNVVHRWLVHDPSLWCAAGMAMLLYWASAPRARTIIVAFLVGFLPLTVWIWDVPFLGRPICHCCHDGRLVLPVLGRIRSMHVYALSFSLFFAILAITAEVRSWRRCSR